MLCACGGPAAPLRPQLPDGEGVYTLRLNRPPSLTGAPELYFEVQTAAGWERVALENPEDDQDLLATLLATAEQDPAGLFRVDAAYRHETHPYAEHTARVVRLISLTPPPSGEAPSPPSPPSAPSALSAPAAPSSGR